MTFGGKQRTMGSIYRWRSRRVSKRSRSRYLLVNSLRPNSLKYNRIIRGIVDLMKKLEKQGLFHRYAHQDENKVCIDKAAKLLDKAIQRFDVSLQPFYFIYQLTASCQLPRRTCKSVSFSSNNVCRVRLLNWMGLVGIGMGRFWSHRR